jgi:putative hydroxymethylpyrimidine transport system substrate-binding protein
MPMRPELRRRGALLAASLICTALCAGCGEVHARLTLGPPRPLTVAIGGQPSALYASLYTARADGDFARGALSVTIARPPGSDPLRALELGSADVAIVSEPALLAARDDGAQVVAIAALVRQPLDGIVSLARQPVTGARALSGRTIALSPTPLARAQLASALASVHLSPSRIRQITVAGDLNAALRARRAVATLGGLWPIDAVALTLAHQQPQVLEIQRAGVPTYSQLVVVVRVNEAHRNGPLLRAFLQSLTRGERAAAANPAAAAATLAKLNPRLSAQFERAVLAITLPIASPSDSSKPFGYQDPYAWQTFGAWMYRYGLIAHARDAGLAITDEFLPGQGAGG